MFDGLYIELAIISSPFSFLGIYKISVGHVVKSVSSMVHIVLTSSKYHATNVQLLCI